MSSVPAEASVALAERSSSPEPKLFTALRKETSQRWPGGSHMVSGAQQGRLLHMLVGLSRASRVLELGCFSGYAALWMALALPAGGSLLSLERDKAAAEVARRHLDAAGVGERVEIREGDAYESLSALSPTESPFELIVCRGSQPASCLRHAANLLAPHGLLVLQHAPAVGESTDALAARIERSLGSAAEVLPEMRVVTLPSPDGDGGLLSMFGRATPADEE